MIPLRVLICDDELMARRRAKRLLAAMSDVHVAAECENAEEVRARLAEGELDVLLLDVQMPGETGLQLAATLPDPKPFLIFVTAHAEHAVSAFDLGAIDYVMKPLEEERLAKAIARARAWVERAQTTERPATPAPAPMTIAIATRNGMVLFAPTDVTHCTFDGQLATVHAAGKAVLTELSLNDL